MYHPCSNGGAERFVQTVKRGLSAIYIEKGKKLDNFLLSYRVTPSSVTGKPPCELFLGRQMRTRIDLIKQTTSNTPTSPLFNRMKDYTENVRRRVHGRQDVRIFVPGQPVLVVNHVGKPKCLHGQIIGKVADRTYIVNINEREVKRHIDDLLPHFATNDGDKDDNDIWMYGTSHHPDPDPR